MRFSVYCFCVLNFNESKIRKTKAVKKLCTKEKVIIRLNFNPGLALTGFLPTLRCLQQVNPDMSPRSNRKKAALRQRSTLKKHVTSMSPELEPAIWSRDTGQRIPCFDRCQLTATWMSKGRFKPRVHVLCQPTRKAREN